MASPLIKLRLAQREMALTINERALRRTFREHKLGTHGLAVYDINLPKFSFRVSRAS